MPAPSAAPVVGLILAAGKGTRMKSRRPKAVHRLLDKPLGRYGIDLCRRLGVERVLVAVGYSAEEVRASLGEDVEYAVQAEQRGTADAVRAAAPLLAGEEGTLLLLQADTVLVPDQTVRALLQRHAETGAAATLLTATLEQPGAYGRILRDSNGAVDRIAEARGASPDETAVREINVGCYVFRLPALLTALEEVRADPTTGEFYLTDVIAVLRRSGGAIETVEAEDAASALGINDRVQLAAAAAVLRERILREHMLGGVTIEDPANTYIGPDVRIGQDTVIRPMTFLSGKSTVGEDCDLGPFLRVTDCVLGSGVSAQNAVLAESEIGDGTRIGPFAQLRPGCRVGRKVKIGNFVELKKAELEDGVSAGHLAYIGDAVVGEKSNIGAGTITCNYDGKRKHVTRIGKGAFIGSHTTLVAPVEVGPGAYTAAGAVITETVPEEALAIARARQINKTGWVRARREREEQG